ncbi:uncharacterized protein SPAPADRAFT_59917 [Spathaspora passalidarum NRRL Y-27907]|uniref:Uncharacterized protein n=1 Tax=Spathaspora passalidarum (strain NRRL Y-27907 / 11-Y1) TaxID=619300 RepID=G3AIS0_SPAPN|nr:uncharacterized protein SPAPADRAFT_59917 [Spathaspora passalidarum NRRL Y-27907]EGW34485.1 hypothetical protein SPAPADRAFT_59917 [Spathaspora passalidarum NRRL Y-27907]
MESKRIQKHNVKKIRYEKLKEVGRRATEASIKKSFSSGKVESCFPTIASTAQGSEILREASKQFIEFWQSETLNEIDHIYEERDIETKLDELDEIVQAAEERKRSRTSKPENVDLLSAKEIIDSNIVSKGTVALEKLQLIHDSLRAENLDTYKQLQELVKESNQLAEETKSALASASLAKTIEICDDENEHLAALARTFAEKYL